MTRRDTLQCVHEPFGDAFYYGPERLSERYEKDKEGRLDSGFSESTFRTILERIERENSEVGLPVGPSIAANPSLSSCVQCSSHHIAPFSLLKFEPSYLSKCIFSSFNLLSLCPLCLSEFE